MMRDLARLDLLVPEKHFNMVQALTARYISYGWQEDILPSGDIRIRIHSEDRSVLDALQFVVRALYPVVSWERTQVEAEDWAEAWREFFTPVEAGDFLILPPWLTDSAEAAEAAKRGLKPIVIEPKSAFGTGHHPSTTLCLQALSLLREAGHIRAGQRFLDLGTGTGVLGLGCVGLGLTGTGLDIDPLAVDNATENRGLNHADAVFELKEGSLEGVAGQMFDVVIANIMAAPLIEMAASLVKLVRSGGCLVLSGLLASQAADVEAAYSDLGKPGCLRAPSLVVDNTALDNPSDSTTDALEEWVCLFWPAQG